MGVKGWGERAKYLPVVSVTIPAILIYFPRFPRFRFLHINNRKRGKRGKRGNSFENSVFVLIIGEMTFKSVRLHGKKFLALTSQINEKGRAY